ncbi:MAG: hypothetical protein ACXWEW_07340 [Nitrososphaeraceae archaeon]
MIVIIIYSTKEKITDWDKKVIKRPISLSDEKQKTLLKDEVWKYGEKEDTINYILFIICELTGKLY